MLEVLLQRPVYGYPLKLKSEPTVREAVLFLLDTLVENGSSAAFRMRDDFVTSLAKRKTQFEIQGAVVSHYFSNI